MPKISKTESVKKRVLKKSSSSSVWALISILSLPTVALSLASLGWNSFVAFFSACLVTLAILIIEALVRGKVWIFEDGFKHIFEHEDTPFRIMVVAGGVLLILESILMIEIFQNPAFDGFVLNIIAKKQCSNPSSYVAEIICPHYTENLTNQKRDMERHDFPMQYSLEQAAKSHMIPSAIAGTCAILPAERLGQIQDGQQIKFFAYCQPWQAGTCKPSDKGVSAIITTDLKRNETGYYAPITWQQDSQSETYLSIVNSTKAMEMLDNYLIERCNKLTEALIKPVIE